MSDSARPMLGDDVAGLNVEGGQDAARTGPCHDLPWQPGQASFDLAGSQRLVLSNALIVNEDSDRQLGAVLDV